MCSAQYEFIEVGTFASTLLLLKIVCIRCLTDIPLTSITTTKVEAWKLTKAEPLTKANILEHYSKRILHR